MKKENGRRRTVSGRINLRNSFRCPIVSCPEEFELKVCGGYWPLEERLLESTFLPERREVWQFPGANLPVGQHWDAAGLQVELSETSGARGHRLKRGWTHGPATTQSGPMNYTRTLRFSVLMFPSLSPFFVSLSSFIFHTSLYYRSPSISPSHAAFLFFLLLLPFRLFLSLILVIVGVPCPSFAPASIVSDC